MHNLEPDIRNTVRAVIIRDGNILLLRKEYEDGSRLFALPGGGQETGESLIESLQRECREEIGTEVEIGGLLHVADWLKQRKTPQNTTRHIVEFLFTCHVAKDYLPVNGHVPDPHQVEVCWVSLTELKNLPLNPGSLTAFIEKGINNQSGIYLGKLN